MPEGRVLAAGAVGDEPETRAEGQLHRGIEGEQAQLPVAHAQEGGDLPHEAFHGAETEGGGVGGCRRPFPRVPRLASDRPAPVHGLDTYADRDAHHRVVEAELQVAAAGAEVAALADARPRRAKHRSGEEEAGEAELHRAFRQQVHPQITDRGPADERGVDTEAGRRRGRGHAASGRSRIGGGGRRAHFGVLAPTNPNPRALVFDGVDDAYQSRLVPILIGGRARSAHVDVVPDLDAMGATPVDGHLVLGDGDDPPGARALHQLALGYRVLGGSSAAHGGGVGRRRVRCGWRQRRARGPVRVPGELHAHRAAAFELDPERPSHLMEACDGRGLFPVEDDSRPGEVDDE